MSEKQKPRPNLNPLLYWKQGFPTSPVATAEVTSDGEKQTQTPQLSLDDQIKQALLQQMQGGGNNLLALAKELNKPRDLVGESNRMSNVVGGFSNPFSPGGMFGGDKALHKQISPENLAKSQGMTAVNQWKAGRTPFVVRDDFNAPSRNLPKMQPVYGNIPGDMLAGVKMPDKTNFMGYQYPGSPNIYGGGNATKPDPTYLDPNSPAPSINVNGNVFGPGQLKNAQNAAAVGAGPLNPFATSPINQKESRLPNFGMPPQTTAPVLPSANAAVFGPPAPNQAQMANMVLSALQGFAPAQRATTGSTNDMRRRFGTELEGEPAPLEKLLQFFSRTRVSP